MWVSKSTEIDDDDDEEKDPEEASHDHVKNDIQPLLAEKFG